MTPEAMLDVQTLVARRIELGYSHRELERLIGASSGVIRGLEDARGHGRVTLDLLFRVAEALQVPAGQLLRHEDRCKALRAPVSREAAKEGTALSEDARRVGQLLLAAGKGVPPIALVRAASLNCGQVNSAVSELQRLADAPDALLRVTTNNSRVALLPRDNAITTDEVVALERQVMAVDELGRPAARMLSAVVHGEIISDREQNMRRGDRPHLQSLLKRGLITRDAGGRLTLSGEVAFSLGLSTARDAGLRPPAPAGAAGNQVKPRRSRR